VIVLVDTDVLIDVALDRKPHVSDAAALLDALELRAGTGYLAWHTVSNLFYLVSPVRGRNQTREFLLDLTRFIHVAPATTEVLRYAAALRMPDFEDAMQVAAAVACRAAVIATRNTADYKSSPVRAAHPGAVLGLLQGAH
jgi:predicted nucleic acid-binding protein